MHCGQRQSVARSMCQAADVRGGACTTSIITVVSRCVVTRTQVLRVVPREEPAGAQAEVPCALQRPAKAPPPAMDAAGLARHLSVAELQVSARCAPPPLLGPAMPVRTRSVPAVGCAVCGGIARLCVAVWHWSALLLRG